MHLSAGGSGGVPRVSYGRVRRAYFLRGPRQINLVRHDLSSRGVNSSWDCALVCSKMAALHCVAAHQLVVAIPHFMISKLILHNCVVCKMI